jgi:hypothetical protein
LPGLTVAYVFAIAATLVLAWATPPFMPYITYGFDTYAAKPERYLADRFLSYSEGRWHFLHRIKNENGEREYRIIALSDSAQEANYVRIRPHPAQNPRVAPTQFPWSEEYASAPDRKPCPISRLASFTRPSPSSVLSPRATALP